MTDSQEEESSGEPKDCFNISMGIGMPGGTVPEDSRRIAVHLYRHKDEIMQTVVPRDILAQMIRQQAEALINAIHQQMDRQEKTNG